MLSSLRSQFEAQRSQVLNNLASNRPTKAYRRKDKRDWLAGLILWSAYTDKMAKALAPILFAIVAETGKDAMSQVGRQPSQFDPTTTPVMDFSQQRSSKIATDVNAETEKQLRASLSQGADNNETDSQMRARVEAVFGAALTYRADRITTTEMTRAEGFADVQAWSQAGNVTGKEWFCTLDERTCPFCESLDGVVVSLDEDYLTLGDVMNVDGQSLAINYDDVGEPPAHANCRCQLLPVTVSLNDL